MVLTLAGCKAARVGNALPVRFKIGCINRTATYPFEECQFLAIRSQTGVEWTETTPVRQPLGLVRGDTGSFIEGHHPIVAGLTNGPRFPNWKEQPVIGQKCILPRCLGLRWRKNRSGRSSHQVTGNDA